MTPITVWRRPRKSGSATPLVVLLHGRGADEYDLLELADLLPQAFAYASPRGLVALDGGGFTWFENTGVARPLASSVRHSVAVLRTWLDDAAVAPQTRKCYLLGFSAGMMMASALLFDDPRRFAGAILLSGALVSGDGVMAPGRFAGLPIFYGRGSLDDVIPAPLVAATEAYLRERSGAGLTERRYEHAHSISQREVRDIAAWLEERE